VTGPATEVPVPSPASALGPVRALAPVRAAGPVRRRGGRRRWGGLVLAVAVAVGAGALTGCGDDDEPADDDPVEAGRPGDVEDGQPAEPAEAELTVDVEQVGSSLRIGWTVTNEGDATLLVFDGRQADDSPDDELADAYVTGRDGDTVEVARRVFPVPGGVEVDATMPGTLAVELAAGQSTSGRELVILPAEYQPAAPDGGGDPPPDDPSAAVFCVGVGPLDALDTSRSPADGPGHWFVPHSEPNAARQTLLCGDPVDLADP
jgi:hypothetical protein